MMANSVNKNTNSYLLVYFQSSWRGRVQFKAPKISGLHLGD